MSSEKENTNTHYPDELTFQEFVQGLAEIILWIKRKVVSLAFCLLLSYIISFIWLSRQQETYSAKLSFILNDDSNSQVSNLSGLLGQLGLPIPTGKYNVDKLLEIAKSRKLLTATLFKKKTINGQNDYLANHFLSIYGLPEKWAKNNPELKSFAFLSGQVDSFNLRESFALKSLHTIIMGSPENRVSALFSTDYGRTDYIMSFTTTTLTEELSLAFTNEIYDQVEDFFAQESEKGSELYGLILQKRDSLLQAINSATYEVALEKDRSFGNFRNTNSITIATLETRLAGLEAAYREIEKNLSNAELALKSNTPLIRLLDRPLPPLQKNSPNYFRVFIFASAFGIFLFLVFHVLSTVFQLVQNKSKN